MTLLVFVEVISRFVFNIGFMWMEEATLTCGAWFVLFGMSYGVKVGAHIGVDAFVKSLPPKAKKITSIAAVFICLCYCGMFFYGSMVYLAKMYDVGLAMEDIHLPAFLINVLNPDSAWDILKIDVDDPLMPIWIMQSILLFGFALLFYRFLQLLIKIIQGKTQGFQFADEAKESMHLIQEVSADKETQSQEAKL
jgi:C4-dicarboxylate transporter DctQ subunit